MGLFEEEEEGTGVGNNVVKVEGAEPGTPDTHTLNVNMTQCHLSALQNLRNCDLGFFLIMTHSTKKGIILCDFSS